MLLRPRQKQFVERSLSALETHGNALGVAPTGAGKTIMLSAVAGRAVDGSDARACVLAHRDELTNQNRSKFARINPEITTSVVDAREKAWNGQVTFAMVPTLARSSNLDALPALDLLVIDEAHHAAAESYRRIIDRARDRNPDCRVYGVTATPTPGSLPTKRRAHCSRASAINFRRALQRSQTSKSACRRVPTAFTSFARSHRMRPPSPASGTAENGTLSAQSCARAFMMCRSSRTPVRRPTLG
ncbi:hypothetical protein DZD18_02210 [Rhodobacteraceae bacterium W635]|uniref:DEAD/DEAH box helicase n=1 Tax=Nioella halotolerans TaxID=2303578 RepID=UPI000E3CFFC1|nr:hypothetical protein DZD18_02210 [Rhodobacteraceae bacterium W635]